MTRRRFDKAREYHRKVCTRSYRNDGAVEWRFVYGGRLNCYLVPMTPQDERRAFRTTPGFRGFL